MRNFLRVLCVGIAIGGLFGYWVAEEKQRRALKAAEEAFENDPEVIAHRREREAHYRIDNFMDSLEDGDA
jgi:predicted negative regulator of RcsB-dependent stress response